MSCRFGISAAHPEQFLALPSKLPGRLAAIEFPGDMLESAAGFQKLSQLSKNGVFLCGRDFISPEIAALIPEENCKLRSELENHFQQRCAKAAELGVESFSVAFDIFQAVTSPVYRDKLGAFLRRCAGVIHDFRQTLYLVCRVPGGGSFDRWEDILMFRRELLCPGIEMMLELHPHEPGASEAIAAALKCFRFHDGRRRICYDSSVGNTLTGAALKRCSESCARELEQETVIFFYSGSGKIDSTRTGELEMLLNSCLPVEEES